MTATVTRLKLVRDMRASTTQHAEASARLRAGLPIPSWCQQRRSWLDRLLWIECDGCGMKHPRFL
jgi:hypothetical protein